MADLKWGLTDYAERTLNVFGHDWHRDRLLAEGWQPETDEPEPGPTQKEVREQRARRKGAWDEVD